jgi:DNA-directed RNA polymerase subunit RPC12/RpoP
MFCICSAADSVNVGAVIVISLIFIANFYKPNVNTFMYLGEWKEKTQHKRKSKLGVEHSYERTKTMVLLRCDACDREFERPRRKINPDRLNNNFFHVCKDCDSKRFAQRRGVERRKIWKLTASSNLPIGKL